MAMPNEITSRTTVMRHTAERRVYMRWNIGAPAALVLPDKTVECLVRDISAGGAGVRADLTPRLGSEVGLAVSRSLHIPSLVARTTADVIGLDFLIDEAEKDRFVQFILNGLRPHEW